MKTVPALAVAAVLFLTPTPGLAQATETEITGVTAEVVELRQAGGVLRLAVRFANSRARPRPCLPGRCMYVSTADGGVWRSDDAGLTGPTIPTGARRTAGFR